MGNLDWSSKFSLDMSQNRCECKKVHPEERNYLAFDQQVFFCVSEMDQKLG